MIYLATPYSKYPAGITAAFERAAQLAGELLKKRGVAVFSPIAHTHPIAIHGGIDPLNHDIWLPFDAAMMRASSSLLVAKMEGWEQSVGIAHEIEAFRKAGKPISYLNPDTLEIE